MVKKKTIDAVGIEGAKATVETVQEVPEVEPVIPAGKTLVNEDALQKLIQRTEALESKVSEQAKEIAATADKARLERYRSANTPKGGSVVTLNQLNGLTVVGWLNMPVNICEKDPTGRYKEDQTRVLLMEDGTRREDALSNFTKSLTRIPATIISRRVVVTDIGEQELLSVACENGKDYEIDVRFVNA